MTSNVAITEKSEKQNVGDIIQLGLRGKQGAFSDKVTAGLDDFTNKPVVQCYLRVSKILL